MRALALLEQAQNEGVMLALINGRLTWSADHEPPAVLLSSIRNHRLEVIEALRAVNEAADNERSQEWLATLARLLACSPEYLLKHGFVDEHDLIEQMDTDPRLAAALIQSNPSWQSCPTTTQASPEDEFREQYAHEREEAGLENQPSRDWLCARNALHDHILGACSICRPPLERYCSTGQALRSRYLEATR